MNREKNYGAVKKAIRDYSTALKSGDYNIIKKYIKTSPNTNTDVLEKHFKAISEEPTPEVTTLGVNLISDTFAIAQFYTKLCCL